ncbi:MAG: hypothetical protein SGBAC_008355 [Bacillariaceae sp.]
MGAFLIIIPQTTMLALERRDLITHDDDPDYSEAEDPLLTQESASVTDSVDLLIERCPLLFNPHIFEGEEHDKEEAEEVSDEYADEYDFDTDDVSFIEYDIALKDTSSSPEGRSTPRTLAPRRRMRLPSSLAAAEDRFHDDACGDSLFGDDGDGDDGKDANVSSQSSPRPSSTQEVRLLDSRQQQLVAE